MTTPLRADEFIPVMKHREVDSSRYLEQQAATAATAASKASSSSSEKKSKSGDKEKSNKQKDGKKSNKKTKSGGQEEGSVDLMSTWTTTDSSRKSKSSSKKHSSSTGISSAAAIDDLLGLSWDTAPASATVSVSFPPAAAQAQPALLEIKDEIIDSKKKSKKSKGTKQRSDQWILGARHGDIEVYYYTSVASSTITATFLVENLSNATCCVDFGINNCPSQLRPTATMARLAADLLPEAQTQASLQFQFDGNPFTVAYKISGAIRVTKKGPMGSDISSCIASISASPSVFMAPHVVDEDGFAALISKSSSRWAASSTLINVTSKPKHAMKVVASRLNAHVVETESSKAMSMCAKFAGGGFIFILTKVGKDGASVNIDVKCLLSSKQESQQAADALIGLVQDGSI